MTPKQPDLPPNASLYRKIAAVSGAISRVEKDGYNPQLKYKYATPATVMEAIKPLLAEHTLAIVPQVAGVVKEPTGSKTQSGAEKVLTRVEMTYLIVDGDSGESLAVPWVGEGEDWSDKGIAKAQTIALRTFLIQLFQIPSDDDETDPDARQAQPPRQQPWLQPARPTPHAGASFEPPTEAPSAGEKRQRTIAELIGAIRSLWQEERDLGGDTPAEELAIDLERQTREQLIELGTRLRARVVALQQHAEPVAA